jgi:hypothetical protein
MKCFHKKKFSTKRTQKHIHPYRWWQNTWCCSHTVETRTSKNCGGSVPSIFVTVWRIASTTCSQKHRMLLSKRFDNYINVHLLTTRYFFLCGFSTTSQTWTCVFVHAFSAWMNSYFLLRTLHNINLVGQTTEGILHLVWSSLDKALHEFRLDILHVLQ